MMSQIGNVLLCTTAAGTMGNLAAVLAHCDRRGSEVTPPPLSPLLPSPPR